MLLCVDQVLQIQAFLKLPESAHTDHAWRFRLLKTALLAWVKQWVCEPAVGEMLLHEHELHLYNIGKQCVRLDVLSVFPVLFSAV